MRSRADIEYQAVMAHTSCALMWLKQFLEEFMLEVQLPMNMYCDNQTAIHIDSNPAFHKRTKHIEVDCHIVRERIKKVVIATLFGSAGT